MKSRGSSFNRENRGKRSSCSCSITEGETNLRHYLTKLGLPSALHKSIISVYNSLESRIWLVDNSTEMNVKDSRLMMADDKFEKIDKGDDASRWSEQLQCLDFHIKMSARAWIPTKFWLTNKPYGEAQRYGVSWGDTFNWKCERERATQKLLKQLSPEKKSNPLEVEVCKVIKKLAPEESRLRKEGKFISVVICTQGMPTDEFGEKGHGVVNECIKSFKQLSKLPVKIVVRLCTSDKKVMHLYKKVDLNVDCDVLGDFWQESMEVYLHNPWLTYGIGLHRIREAGLGLDLMDYIDERPLTLDELYEWFLIFFVGDAKNTSLHHPAKDWKRFLSDLQAILKHEKLVWNPVKNKLYPWIDVDMLHSVYQRKKGSSHSKAPGRRSSDHHDAPDKPESPPGHRAGHHRRATVDDPYVHRKSSSFHERSTKTGFGRSHSCEDSNFHFKKGQSFHTKDPASHKPHISRLNSFNDPLKSSEIIKTELRQCLFGIDNNDPAERNLSTVIKEWSHEPPKYNKLRPLHILLFEAPVLLPPNNPLVEHHEYFDKWKILHRDAFKDEDGEKLDLVVHKIARKCKVFLHPDKWPMDLNEDQKFLLQSIWDVFQESALF